MKLNILLITLAIGFGGEAVFADDQARMQACDEVTHKFGSYEMCVKSQESPEKIKACGLNTSLPATFSYCLNSKTYANQVLGCAAASEISKSFKACLEITSRRKLVYAEIEYCGATSWRHSELLKCLNRFGGDSAFFR